MIRTLSAILLILAIAAALALWVRYGEADMPPKDPTSQSATSPPRPVMTMPPLSDQEKQVILGRGAERPFTGQYWNTFEPGVYLCRQCGAPLYLSDSKFDGHCGWPSFDDEILGAVRRQSDADGQRTEILCANCGGHLGHVFEGEGLTEKNTRHCVNSISLRFVGEKEWPLQRAIFAGGCFWGVEHYFRQAPGVLRVRSGYTGGAVPNPAYEQVCTGKTGHAEAVEIIFDPARTSYEDLAKLFLEIHDPTQVDRQGPDVGSQYRSAVFHADDRQKQIAQQLIDQLRSLGYDVATKLEPAGAFYVAEQYHQDYLAKHPGRYDCHVRVKRFEPATKP